jgi:hypothetical protein
MGAEDEVSFDPGYLLNSRSIFVEFGSSRLKKVDEY